MARLGLRPTLGRLEAVTLVAGAMIGSGILILPGLMAAQLPSPALVLLALAAGGALSVVGCLVVAELATMFPRAGGQYQYLKEGLGPLWGYLFGWAMFWVALTGILAGIAAAFSNFFAVLVPLPGAPTRLVLGGVDTGLVLPAWGNAYVAVALVWGVTGLNYLGTRAAGRLASTSLAAKYVGLAALGLLLLFGARAPGAFQDAFPPGAAASLVGGFAAALAFALFAYDGWVAVTFVASEVREPRRTLPAALLLGPLLVVALYLVLTAAYFAVLPAADAAAVGRDPGRLIAVEAALRAVGPGGALVIAGVALVSLLGTANAFALSAPRVFYAMARDGALFPRMAKLAGPGQVPAFAMFAAALWSSLLVLTGLYDRLVFMVVFAMWLFYALTAVAHVRLRRTAPGLERPFRTPLGPVLPGLFLASAAFVLMGILGTGAAAYGLLALGLVLLGVPFYYVQRRAGRAPG